MGRRRGDDLPGEGPWELPEPDEETKKRIEREVDETLGEIAEDEATDPMASEIALDCGKEKFNVMLMVTAPDNPRTPGAPLGHASYHISHRKLGSWGGNLAHAGSPIGALLDRAGIGNPLRISIKVEPASATLPFISYLWSIPSASASYLFAGVYWSRKGPHFDRGDKDAIEMAEKGRLDVQTIFIIPDFIVAQAFVAALERIGAWPGSPARKVVVEEWSIGHVTHGLQDQLPGKGMWPI